MIGTAGIHHVTGIAGDAQRNVDFYAGVLGLRLVKKTVNFDDPRTYHLYYGDGVGTPGSIITFFPWPRAKQGRAGVGQAAVTSLAIPAESTGYWLQRFVTHGVLHERPTKRFGDVVLPFRDRDGLMLELIATDNLGSRTVWSESNVPAEHAIRCVHSVSLWEHSVAEVERVLVEGLDFRRVGQDESIVRFTTGDGGASSIVDVREVGGFLSPIEAAGTIHHVAFRAANRQDEEEMRAQFLALGLSPTPVIDRKYFESVYAREPGGVLFELATDAPGFAIDEPIDALGQLLQLPAQYEADRQRIEGRLPALHAALTPPLYQPSAPTETT
jgi:glyoxalase family protein